MQKFSRIILTVVVVSLASAVPSNTQAGSGAADVAARIDQIIFDESSFKSLTPADDATFLRRATLDIIGRPATPAELTRFGLDPSPEKRMQTVEQLLASPDYASTWARYWSDAIFRRATNVRANLVRAEFEDWMTRELSENHGWNTIVTELVTATGSVTDNGATALMFAHEGVPEEIAAEASRLFLGVQIQCANCHNHPWDRWKREQFHEFVAFFPRVSVRRDPSTEKKNDFQIVSVDTDRKKGPGISKFMLTRLDRDGDGFISEKEVQKTPVARIYRKNRELIDKDDDGKISIAEILTAQPPDNNRPGQGSTEHYMPDLADPASQGKQVDPVFFIDDQHVKAGMNDLERRKSAADLITDRENPWFARAIVNRMWYEMTGTAFYTPVDDIGPDREVVHAEALRVAADGFASSGYDLKWLIRTIAGTKIYQRAPDSSAEGFAHSEPMRMRSDQLYAAICQTLGVTEIALKPGDGKYMAARRMPQPGREEFARIFGFDPSTPRTDLTGSIPEALFLMNSPQVSRMISDPSPLSTISRISSSVVSDDEIVSEIYLTAVGREPSAGELEIAREYLAADSVRTGLEDLLWALVNSPEFRSKR